MDIMKKNIDYDEWDDIPQVSRISRHDLKFYIGQLKDRKDIYHPHDVVQYPHLSNLVVRFTLEEAYPNPDVDW